MYLFYIKNGIFYFVYIILVIYACMTGVYFNSQAILIFLDPSSRLFI